MEISIVVLRIEQMIEEFTINADMSDFDEEKKWNDRIDALDQAIEYLWQYEDLME